jgi:hypothetical protein
MNLSKIIGIVIIIASLIVGYVGAKKVADSTNTVNLLGIKIDASNSSGKQLGYIYLGFALVLFAGGVYTINKARNN